MLVARCTRSWSTRARSTLGGGRRILSGVSRTYKRCFSTTIPDCYSTSTQPKSNLGAPRGIKHRVSHGLCHLLLFSLSYPQAMHIHQVQRMLDKRTYSDVRGFTRIPYDFFRGFCMLFLRLDPCFGQSSSTYYPTGLFCE